MYRTFALVLCLTLAPLGAAMAVDKGATEKELSGMSIIGNDEAPKALYIVPWKYSEIGVETSLNRLLNENALPVDRDVFMRQLDFFEVSANKSGK